MRFVIVLLLAMLLAGCGTRMTWTPPSPTADVKTPTGYRDALLEHVAILDTAVGRINTTCRSGEISGCQQVLDNQALPFTTAVQWIKTTTPPQACVTLFSGYLPLIDFGTPILGEVKIEANQGNKAGAVAVLDRRYPPYNKSKSIADQPIPNDTCR